MIRRFLTTGALLCVAVAASLVALEFGVRWLTPQFDPTGRIGFECEDGYFIAPRNAELRQWTNTGDFDITVRTNERGFRDDKELTSGTAKDLYVVGDSFSFGFGVPVSSRYSNLIESKSEMPVHNMSIPNDLDGYLLALRHARSTGIPIRRVIVGICMENDIANYAAEPQRCVPADPRESHSIERISRLSFFELKTMLSANSAAYSAFTAIIHQNSSLRDAAQRLGLLHDTVYAGDGGFNTDAITRSADRVEDIANQFEVTALIIPSRALWLGSNRDIEARIHASFVQELRARHIETVDLRPEFEASGDPLRYHFPNDGHWNARGHALAAGQLLDRILE